ncbi:methyltransferase domain-containing protein [Myxococcota bacterium]|nr:methyltransferase domain-containing protein [Myxococcota bacterium]MCZ7617242.1 class I SAM-dependent methyltransferase [Myxococcota bacterium]
MTREDPVVEEFTRQATAMAEAPAFRAADVLSRVARAAGADFAGRVLDLACGPGIVAEAIGPLASSLVGVDATPRMVQLAGTRCREAGLSNCSFCIAPAEILPFDRESFDMVVTRLSLHHFRDPGIVLTEIRRVLRANGRLIVMDIVSSPEESQALLHNSLERLRDPTHVRMLSEFELSSTVAGYGFELLSEESWEQDRTFEEWASVVADSSRTEALGVVMQSLAQAGCSAGINLRLMDGEVRFSHRWKLIVARRT